jgi:integrase
MSATKNHRGWGHVRRLPSRRFHDSYIGPNGSRHNAPTTFDQRMDAELWLGRERRMILDTALGGQPWISPAERAAASTVARETLSVYASRWIAQRNVKPRTRIHYETILTDHISPKLGDIAVSGLAPQTVRNWYAGCLVGKPTLRSHAYGLLKSICNTALKDGLIDRNPCQIDGASTVKSKTEAVVPSVDELATIADTILPKFKALVLISGWCGLRYGEVSELRRKDIGKGCEVISIGRGVTHRTARQAGNGGSRCMIDTPKSGKTRNVVVPPHIRADLANHLDSFVGDGTESLLFAPVRGGCHLSDKVIRDALQPALAAVGREGMRIHDLRHFAGTQTAQVGSLVETMGRLGHSTVTASLRYQHQVSGADVKIAEALSGLAQRPALAVVADDDQASATA